jgi:hypothetical protein
MNMPQNFIVSSHRLSMNSMSRRSSIASPFFFSPSWSNRYIERERSEHILLRNIWRRSLRYLWSGDLRDIRIHSFTIFSSLERTRLRSITRRPLSSNSFGVRRKPVQSRYPNHLNKPFRPVYILSSRWNE